MVIPASIRQEAKLKPGTPLNVELEAGAVRITRAVSRPKLVKVDGRLVARPTVPAGELPDIDLAELLEKERDRWPS